MLWLLGVLPQTMRISYETNSRFKDPAVPYAISIMDYCLFKVLFGIFVSDSLLMTASAARLALLHPTGSLCTGVALLRGRLLLKVPKNFSALLLLFPRFSSAWW